MEIRSFKKKNKKYKHYVFSYEDYFGSTNLYIEVKIGNIHFFTHNEKKFENNLFKFYQYFYKKNSLYICAYGRYQKRTNDTSNDCVEVPFVSKPVRENFL